MELSIDQMNGTKLGKYAKIGISESFSDAIDLRTDYELLALLGKDTEQAVSSLRIEAAIIALGGYSPAVAGMFNGTPLYQEYMTIIRMQEKLEDLHAEMDCCPHCCDWSDHYPCPTHG